VHVVGESLHVTEAEAPGKGDGVAARDDAADPAVDVAETWERRNALAVWAAADRMVRGRPLSIACRLESLPERSWSWKVPPGSRTRYVSSI
jgi:hypothetical protein